MNPQAKPFFLDSDPGKRFCLYHPPRGICRGCVLFVPPFAEEMNKSRRMVAMQSRALSEIGFAVLSIDLYGCGDSSGDFGQARWEIWMTDLAMSLRWLEQRHDAPVALWGLRFGALMMLDFARACAGDFSRFILWQPVPGGEAHLAQFLRLRVAGEMLAGGKTSVQGLRKEIASRGALEIAGYDLSRDIAENMERLKLAELGVPGRMHHWLETISDMQNPLPPAGARVIEAWEKRGIASEVVRVEGEPFWSTQEITDCPSLIGETTRLFG